MIWLFSGRPLGHLSSSFFPLLAFAIFLQVTSVTSIDVKVSSTESIDPSKPDFISTILPTFYRPDTDEICWRNGIRYTTCSADNGRLVKLDNSQRFQLYQLLQSSAQSDRTDAIQTVVWVMLINLDKSLQNAATHQGNSNNGGDAKRMDKGKVEHFMDPDGDDAAKKKKKKEKKGKPAGGLEESIEDMSPGLRGPDVAKKFGASAVTKAEQDCFIGWLKERAFSTADMDTVLNLIYATHVAPIQGEKKRWSIEGPVKCYQDVFSGSDVPLGTTLEDAWRKGLEGKPEGGKAKRDLSPKAMHDHHDHRHREEEEEEEAEEAAEEARLRKQLHEDKDADGIPDDMEVYHPIMGTHMKDPWKKYRRFSESDGVISAGAFGYAKRSLDKDRTRADLRRPKKSKKYEWINNTFGRLRGVGDPQQIDKQASFRKRSIGGDLWVGEGSGHRGHRHAVLKRGGGVKPYIPGSGGAEYNDGMPAAPTGQNDAGAGSGLTTPSAGSGGGSGSSAISSKPHGFAASVTGGGSAAPVIPKDIKELESLLGDAQPRVIHLDKIYDFRGSAGICTNCKGCIPDSYPKCPAKGQLAIDNGEGWCNGKPPKSVTYDKAGLTPLKVGSNKSIIGISSNAGIRGRGLAVKHQKNVIFHNFRIDEINAPFIWGGDGITLYDTDLVWIDKMTFSMIGRQFIVTGYEAANRVTISNCFFDCQTKWSSTCDDSHYWTVLGYGKSDKVTFSGNHMKHCSGRSPRIANPNDKGGDSVWHVVNTLFDYNTGHSLDMGPGVSALIEGNVFTDVAQTSLHEASPGRAFAPSDAAVCSQCKGPLGRDCQPNAYKNANPVPSTTSAVQVLKDIAGEKMGGALPPGQVAQSCAKVAGAGHSGAAAGAGAGAVVGGPGSTAGDGSAQDGYGNAGAQTSAAPPGVGAAPGASEGGGPYVPGVGLKGPSRSGSSVPGGKVGQPKAVPPQQPIAGDVVVVVGGGGGAGNQPNPAHDGSQKEGYGLAQANAQQLKQLQDQQKKKQQEQQKKKQQQDQKKREQEQKQKPKEEQEKKEKKIQQQQQQQPGH